jgi:hypothetical protein
MDLREKVWSYSAVRLFETCPYAFKLKYIDGISEKPNAFAQHGSLVHSILERYFKGELYAFELADVFQQEYPKAVTEHFPFFNMYKAFYGKTLNYLQNFDGIDGEVVSVEEKFETKFGDYNFVGYADLVMRDDTGLVLIDHKSHSAFKNKAERKEYFRQLYLYAECIKRKYGEYPHKLVFNMFRVPKMEAEIFAPSQSKDDVIWFQNSVKKILENKNWDCKVDEWYCNNLCKFEDCVYGGE